MNFHVKFIEFRFKPLNIDIIIENMFKWTSLYTDRISFVY